MSDVVTTKRREVLESHLQETLDLLQEYESKLRLSDDPKEKRRYRNAIAEQRKLLTSYQTELDTLGHVHSSQLPPVMEAMQTALSLPSPAARPSESPDGLTERIQEMGDLVYRKVIDPWAGPGSLKASQGLSMKLTRKRQREIEESRGTLERLCEHYAHSSFLGSDELWLTARYLGDLKAHFEDLLRLVQTVPESRNTLTAKLRAENHLRAGIVRASRMESDFSKRVRDASQSSPTSAWQAAITGDLETLLSQTATVLASTRDLLASLGRS